MSEPHLGAEIRAGPVPPAKTPELSSVEQVSHNRGAHAYPPGFEYTPAGGARESGESSRLRKDNITTCYKQPKTLGSVLIGLATDAACVLAPLAFVVFLVVVARLHGQAAKTEEFERLDSTIKVLATIFPIAFAAIIGRLTYEIAQWKLEKGSTLQTLERFLGSQTFGGTVLTQFKLQSISFLSLGLIALWSLSPLGAQSLLRLLSLTAQSVHTTFDLSYLNTDATGQLSALGTADISARYVVSQYLSSRASRDASQDQWGNIRIPVFKGNNSDAWTDVGINDMRAERYSSLVGIPVFDPPVRNWTASLESTYMDLQCRNVSTIVGPSVYQNDTRVDMTWPQTKDGFNQTAMYENDTWVGLGVPDSDYETNEPGTLDRTVGWSIATDRSVDMMWNPAFTDSFNPSDYTYMSSPALFQNYSGIEVEPTNVLVQLQSGWNDVGDAFIKAECGVKQKYVESRIQCQHAESMAGATDCSVVQQRASQKPHASELITALTFREILNGITVRLPQATYAGPDTPDLLHAFIGRSFVPYMVFSNWSAGTSDHPHVAAWNESARTEFGEGLAQVLNTFLHLQWIAPTVGQLRSGELRDLDSPELQFHTQAESSKLVKQYRFSEVWGALAFVSAVVFLAGGIASVIFARLCAGPEVLGYASTVIRESTVMNLNPKIKNMPAMEISHLHKEMRVQLGYEGRLIDGTPLLGVGRYEDIANIHGPKRGLRGWMINIWQRPATLGTGKTRLRGVGKERMRQEGDAIPLHDRGPAASG